MQYELKLFSDSDVVVSEEEWRRVPGFQRYEVSSLGRFRNVATGQYLGGTTTHNGYLHIGLIKDGHQHTKLAHRMVAEAFLEPQSTAHTDVNHRNKVRTDNRISNLEWCTRSYNSRHAKSS